MVMALISFTFPDNNNPMFGDSWWVDKEARRKQFGTWAKAFPSNETIKYFATDGKEGKEPDFLSKALTTAGFYTFRNGWKENSTVMVLKASPQENFTPNLIMALSNFGKTVETLCQMQVVTCTAAMQKS